jgi:outer membrane protein TolC
MKRLLTLIFVIAAGITTVSAQFNNTGISAGFFDNSDDKTINYSNFHLPPLAVLFENAKAVPSIEVLGKTEQLARAEVKQQRLHIFSYISAHANYSYGMFDNWGNSSTTLNPVVYQYQGSSQSYWNVGVNLSLPFEDIFDLKGGVHRKQLSADIAQLNKDAAYDELKKQIATLYVQITNDLVTLKTASENAAIYQGAGRLTEEQFHSGNMSIEEFAETKQRENAAVGGYQDLQTKITTEILNLEILTHTPIITNSTTDITLEKISDDIQSNKKTKRTKNK